MSLYGFMFLIHNVTVGSITCYINCSFQHHINVLFKYVYTRQKTCNPGLILRLISSSMVEFVDTC